MLVNYFLELCIQVRSRSLSNITQQNTYTYIIQTTYTVCCANRKNYTVYLCDNFLSARLLRNGLFLDVISSCVYVSGVMFEEFILTSKQSTIMPTLMVHECQSTNMFHFSAVTKEFVTLWQATYEYHQHAYIHNKVLFNICIIVFLTITSV